MKYFPHLNVTTPAYASDPLDTHYTVRLPFAIIVMMIIVIRTIAYDKMISELLVISLFTLKYFILNGHRKYDARLDWLIIEVDKFIVFKPFIFSNKNTVGQIVCLFKNIDVKT